MKILKFIFFAIILLNTCEDKIKIKKVCRQRKIYQSGIATYYGTTFQDKFTTSGQIFDKNKFTAAHRELPLGSIVRVRNTENSKEVIVLVNDRGPVKKTLVLDLSEIAAIHLNMIRKGSAKVEIEVLSSSKNPLKKIFEVYKNLAYCE